MGETEKSLAERLLAVADELAKLSNAKGKELTKEEIALMWSESSASEKD